MAALSHRNVQTSLLNEFSQQRVAEAVRAHCEAFAGRKR